MPESDKPASLRGVIVGLLILLVLVAGWLVFNKITGPRSQAHAVEEWGGYKPRGVYQLREDVFIRQGELKIPVVPTLAQYRESPDKWSEITIFPKGSKIRLTRCEQWSSGTFTTLTIYATPTSGPMSGVELNINAVSVTTRLGGIEGPYNPNPQYLEESD